MKICPSGWWIGVLAALLWAPTAWGAFYYVPIRFTHPDPASVTTWEIVADGKVSQTSFIPGTLANGTLYTIALIEECEVIVVRGCNSNSCSDSNVQVYPLLIEPPGSLDGVWGIFDWFRLNEIQFGPICP
jgi:hypothetical protein